MNIDLNHLETLMARMAQLGIAELDYRQGDERIHLVRTGASPAAPVADTHAPPLTPMPSAPAAAPAQTIIAAPMHGQFYAAQAPDAPPFVQVGDTVSEGQTLYILEVMKTLSRMEAEYPCRIVEILVTNGQPVEPETPLFRVVRINA